MPGAASFAARLRNWLVAGLVLFGNPAIAQQAPSDATAPPAMAAPAETEADTSPPAGEALDVSLLTFGPGPIYWERFGHNAILIRDHREDLAYNYGIFDFSQENFFLNFARGRMSYRMAADPVFLDLRFYNREGRRITEQHLDLTPAQRAQLRDFLVWNAQPDHTRYDYDYFLSNCSTRVRDALDRVLGGALKRQFDQQMTSATYRGEALRLISPDRWLMLLMDAALGPSSDLPLTLQQQSFVPMVLSDAVRKVQITDSDGHTHPLVDGERTIFPGRLPDAPAAAPNLRMPMLGLGLGFAALLLRLTRDSAGKTARRSAAALAVCFNLICGIGGASLALLWAGTEHWAGWRNQNLLLFDPLCLLLIPAMASIARPRRHSGRAQSIANAVTVLAALDLLLKLIPGIPYQANLHWIGLLLPVHCVLAFILWHTRRQAGQLA
jgi:hypothetical protein